jgi:cell pole-organizing protein PopZ
VVRPSHAGRPLSREGSEAGAGLADGAWSFHPHSSRKLVCHIPLTGKLASNLASGIAGDRKTMGASAAREPTMEEILASIRRIIEPEGESAAPVFTSLSGGTPADPAPQAAAQQPSIAPQPDATVAAEPGAHPAIEIVEAAPLIASRPWGVEANDAQPSQAARDLRSPITAGFDRFASALQRLNRRPERSASASIGAVSAGAGMTLAAPAARLAEAGTLRQETSLAVARLRAVADSIGSRSRAPALPAATAAAEPLDAEEEAEAVTEAAILAELAADEAMTFAAAEPAPVLLLPMPVPPEPETEAALEPEIVAEFITVVPPPAANDSVHRRAEADGFDEAELMLALNEELARDPAAVLPAPVAVLPALREVMSAEPRVAELGELIAQEAGGRTAEAFADLASAVRTGTLGSTDEIVRELLKPMLREWLDDNLPHLVERMVQDEIYRAARGSAAA